MGRRNGKFKHYGQYTDVTALPVELVSFDVSATEEGVELLWHTAAEYNNDYFIAQRSTEGVIWHDLDKIVGAVQSNIRRDYRSVDTSPFHGISYYRLIQVDLDGSQANYPPISIRYSEDNKLFYPNPAREQITLTHSSFLI